MLERAVVSVNYPKMWLLVLLVAVVSANPQYTKTAYSGVKGGYSGHEYNYNAGTNQIRYFGNGTQQHYGGRASPAYEESGVGVCFVEVPTATLVRDPSRVPTGNGSRADLSRIRSCCKGYIRNIHNYRLCDPVCTEECVNALCSAPETCTCFPDHVKNVAGFCIPTCPIGCQNGHCAGGECICKDGFKLDRDSKYCVPSCQDNCGGIGIGNCTSPNTCTCKNNYESTPTGSCRPTCSGDCKNGDCVALNECRCKPGYTKDKTGICGPLCSPDCGPNGHCIAPNVCQNPATTTPSNYHPYQPYNPNGQNHYPYNPTDNHRPTYNITSDSQVKPNQPDLLYPYNPINQTLNYPNGPNGILLNQSNPQGPYQTNNQVNQNQPTNYYPYYPSGQPGQYPNNPSGQPGQYNPSGQHGQHNPSGQPGQYNPSGQHGQHNPSGQPGQYNPSGQPGQYNPSGQPGQYNPSGQPGQYNPSGQPGQYNPSGQPGHYNPSGQPGQHNPSGQPGQYNPSGQPGQHSSSGQPGQYNPSGQPGQHNPSGQPGQYNPSGYPALYPNQGYPVDSNHSTPYQPYNPTNQYLYPYGQAEDEDRVPRCSQPCINGYCVEGNRCSCNSGYELDTTDPSGTRCRPHCAGGCQNGVCSAPNFCICDMGYRKEQGVKGGIPRCVKRMKRSTIALLV